MVEENVFAWSAWAYASLFREQSPPRPLGEPPWTELAPLGLTALLHQALKKTGESVPDSSLSLRLRLTARNAVLLELAQRAGKALQDEGIRHLSMKGVATLARFPACRALRPMADVDMLVSSRDFIRAHRCLLALGASADQVYPMSRFWSCERSAHFKLGQLEATVDLHRSIHQWPLLRSLAVSALEQTQVHSGLHLPAPIPSLLLIAAHRARNGFGDDARELLDARLLLDLLESEGWPELLRQSQQDRLDGALLLLLDGIEAYFGLSDADHQGRIALAGRLGPIQRRMIARLEHQPMRIPAQLPFLRMYWSMPAATGQWLAPAVGMAAHVLFRGADALLGGSRGSLE
jgi:hypothetical protein